MTASLFTFVYTAELNSRIVKITIKYNSKGFVLIPCRLGGFNNVLFFKIHPILTKICELYIYG